jgi:uncharacterized protein YjdB
MNRHLALAALAALILPAACDNAPTSPRVAPSRDASLAVVGTPTAGVDHVVITPARAGSDTFNIGALTAVVSLTATAYDASGDPIPGAEFAWSGSTTVFDLSATTGGTVQLTTTARGKRALIVASGSRADTVWVRVRQPVARIALSADSVYLQPAATATFTATVLDSLDQPVAGVVPAWSSRNTGVATVVGGLVTGVAPSAGWVRIRAAAGGKTADGWVAVRNTPFVSSITVSPAVDTLLALNRTKALTAVVRNLDGTVITTPVVWSSNAPSVATVHPVTGVVTAVGRGAAWISATASGVTGTSWIVVKQYSGSITATLVGSNDPAIAPGGTVTVTGSTTDLDGSPVLNPVFLWSSSNTAIATTTGLNVGSTAVTGVGEGVATITATRSPGIYKKTGSVSVLVINVPGGVSSSMVTTGQNHGIVLNWTNTSGIETGYRIERSVNGGAFTLLTTTAANATTYLDPKAGLNQGSTYAYRIKSCNTSGCSTASSTTAQLW